MNLARPPHLLARHDAGRIALEAAGSSLTYGDFDRLTGRISGRLRRSGIRRGDIAALVVRDDAVHLAAMFAIWRLGAVMLSLDWRSSPPEIRQILTRFAPARLIAAAMPMREAVESISLAGLEAETEVDPCIEPLDDAPAIYALSSGTTGLPKAAVITHAQQCARTMSYAVSYPVLRRAGGPRHRRLRPRCRTRDGRRRRSRAGSCPASGPISPAARRCRRRTGESSGPAFRPILRMPMARPRAASRPCWTRGTWIGCRATATCPRSPSPTAGAATWRWPTSASARKSFCTRRSSAPRTCWRQSLCTSRRRSPSSPG